MLGSGLSYCVFDLHLHLLKNQKLWAAAQLCCKTGTQSTFRIGPTARATRWLSIESLWQGYFSCKYRLLTTEVQKGLFAPCPVLNRPAGRKSGIGGYIVTRGDPTTVTQQGWPEHIDSYFYLGKAFIMLTAQLSSPESMEKFILLLKDHLVLLRLFRNRPCSVRL